MIKLLIENQVDSFPFATSGTVTIPATTAGNVLIVLVSSRVGGMQWVGGNHLSSSDGNFTQVPFYTLQGGVLWDWASFAGSTTSVDILYQVTSGGVTSLSFNTSGNLENFFCREFSGLQTPVVVDDYKLTGSASAVTVVGSALAGIGLNDLCFENFCTASQFLQSVQAPWLTDEGLPDANEGHVFQMGVPGTQPAATPLKYNQDNTSTDKYTCASVAFKGVGAAPTSPVDYYTGIPYTPKYVFTDDYNSLAARVIDTNDDIHTIAPIYSNDGRYFDPFTPPFLPGAGLACPWGMTSIGNRYLYVCDQCNGILYRVDMFLGAAIRWAGGGSGSGYPNEIATNWAFDSAMYTVKAGLDGNLYIKVPGYDVICMNMQTTTITVCGVSIAPGFAAEVAGTNSGDPYQTDYSCCADANGNVYAGWEGDNTGHGNLVWKKDSAGATSVIAGTGAAGLSGDGGPASLAVLNAPLGVAIDNNNILYIACTGNNTSPRNNSVRAVNLSGTTQNVCGKTIAPGNIDTLYNFGTAAANLWSVTPDNQGNLLVCDVYGPGACPSSRGWMHLLDANGVYSRIAGNSTGTCGYTGDSGPAISALIGTAFGASIPVAPATFCGGMSSQIVGNPLI